MKQENQFDAFIKDKLGELNTSVPDRVWNAIQEKEDKKRRAGFWWRIRIAVFLILGIAISTITYRSYFVESNDSKTVKKEDDKFETIASKVGQNSKVISGIENDKIENEIQTTSKSIESPSNKINNGFNKSVSIANGSDPANAEFESATDEEKEIENSGKRKILISSRKKSKIKSGKADVMEDGEMSEQNDNEIIPEKSIVKNVDDNEESLSYGPADIVGLHKKKKTVLPTTLHDIKKYSFKKDPIPCPGTDLKSKKSSLEIYAGTDFVLRKFSDTPNSQYLLKRKETQTVKSAFQFGLRYNKPIGAGFSINAGLQYNQINEQFRHTQGNIINYTYVVDASGDTVQTIQTISTRYKQITNRYRMIEVPLMLGYEKKYDRFSFRVNAGVMFNLSSWYKGEVLDHQLAPVSISSSEPSNQYHFNHSLGLSYVGALGIYYAIRGNQQFFIEPHYQYRTKNTSREQLSLKQKDNLWGIRAGIKIRLNP